MTLALRARVPRVGAALGDQLVFSATSLAAVLLFGRLMSAEDFGRFALIQGVCLAASSLLVACVVEPAVILAARAPEGRGLTILASARSLLVSVGLVLAAAAAMTALLVTAWDPAAAVGAAALSLGIPTLTLARRLVYATGARATAGLTLSATYGLLTLPCAAVVATRPSPGLALLALGLPQVVVGGVAASRVPGPMLQLNAATARQLWGLGRWTLLSAALYSATYALLPAFFAAVAGLAVAGDYAAINNLLTPAAQVLAGINLMLIPALARRHVSRGSERWLAEKAATLTAGVALLCTLPLLAAPGAVLAAVYHRAPGGPTVVRVLVLAAVLDGAKQGFAMVSSGRANTRILALARLPSLGVLAMVALLLRATGASWLLAVAVGLAAANLALCLLVRASLARSS